jgi:paraquat-inducible protein B
MAHKSRRPSPLLIGAFVVGGLGLLAVAVIAVAGSKLFTNKQRVVMHFTGSTYGLEVGAPVDFRGVRMGSVVSIEVLYDRATNSFSIPVIAEVDSHAVRDNTGHRPADGDPLLAMPALVQRGLNAQLSMQSLLTGLLYVDLDLRPGRPVTLRGNYRGALEIPTTPTTIQALKTQLDGMDFRKLADDLAAIAASARSIAGGPEIKRALNDLLQITTAARELVQQLNRQVDPLASQTRQTLANADRAISRLGEAADSVRTTARRFDQTAQGVNQLVAPDSELVRKLQTAADEVARGAEGLRRTTADDSPLVQGGEQALHDLSHAARALRDLAELLEREPQSLLRGRK